MALLIGGSFGAWLSPNDEAFLRNCVNTIFLRRSSFVGFQLCSECTPGNKVKISLNIVVDNSTMHINVGNADGFVKVYSEPYWVSGGETLTGIPITLSSLVAIVYFPDWFSVLDDWWGLEYDFLASHVSCSVKYAYSSNY